MHWFPEYNSVFSDVGKHVFVEIYQVGVLNVLLLLGTVCQSARECRQESTTHKDRYSRSRKQGR